MKTWTRPLIVVTAMTLFSLAGVSGCASQGYEKAEETAATLDAAKKDAAATQTVLNKTVAQLQDLVNKPQPSLKPQFQAFSDSLEDLNKRVASLKERSVKLESRRDEWFAAWGVNVQKIQDPGVRADATARMAQAKEEYGKVTQAYRAVEETCQPLSRLLSDLQIALANDLTAGGLQSASNQLPKVNDLRTQANQNLEALIAELGRVSSEISPRIEAVNNSPTPAATP